MAIGIEPIILGGVASFDGILIPFSSLPGIRNIELYDDSAWRLESKVLLAIFEKMSLYLSTLGYSPLGLNFTKSPPSNANTLDAVNQQYTIVTQRIVDRSNNTIYPIPRANTGSNFAIGELIPILIFPGLAKVPGGGQYTGTIGDAIIIPYSVLSAYGAGAFSDFIADLDGRALFFSLFNAIVGEAIKRSPTQESGLLQATIGNTTGLAIPANFTTLPDPLSGIDPLNILKLGLISNTFNFTLQLKLNPTAQTFDIYGGPTISSGGS